jgi:iron-sulfur cluster repair protein YtfE (RIC family)
MANAHEGRQLRVEITRTLYSLHAIVALHFAKEEEVYLPIVDEHLTADEASALFREMEAAATEARAVAA